MFLCMEDFSLLLPYSFIWETPLCPSDTSLEVSYFKKFNLVSKMELNRLIAPCDFHYDSTYPLGLPLLHSSDLTRGITVFVKLSISSLASNRSS